MIETVLIATDGSEHGRRAVDLGADLAAKYGAKVVLLHILLRNHMPEGLLRAAQVEHVSGAGRSEARGLAVLPPEIMARVEKSKQVPLDVLEFIGKKIMAEAERSAKEKGVKRVQTVVDQGDPARQILEQAKARNADLIVIGSRGLGGFKELMVGSVSHKVTQAASCPCLTVK